MVEMLPNFQSIRFKFLSSFWGSGFRYLQEGCHLFGVSRVLRAGLEAWQSSLVNTFPITKKNKYPVVTEAHKECTYAAYAPQQIFSRRPIRAPTGVFPPNKSAGLSARSCVTSQVHEASLKAIFGPSRANEVCITWL